MVTPVTARRLANAVAALAIAGPAVLLGGTAWADDPTPAPVDDTAVEAPVVQPSIGSWIIGGTLLEGTAAAPAKPVSKPVTKPVAKPVTTSVVPRTTTRSTARKPRPSSGIGTAISTTTGPDGATALPFTGNRVDALLPVGITMLVGGVVLTLVARPRRIAA